ncbi:MAG: nucleotidyl transferase AbiEii/AbiGii toxin family protein [Acidobacteria bacterium]|nr:nucleotidyl transferase AbiEii/AbiGii toxin family protein [Acidobacteriota bacterium]
MTKTNLAASIHQRLLNLARRDNRPLNELLQHFAIERFLYRLGKTNHRTAFVLKGAQMLRVWNAPAARPTMDIDLLGMTENNTDNLTSILEECFAIEVEDGVVFDPKSLETKVIRKSDAYQGTRATANGLLGKIKLQLQIDVGFGDAVVPGPVEIELPQLLDFGQPLLWGYSPESAIAEKFHAIVVLDMANTRMKDFYDIWLLSTNLDFNNAVLEEAIRKTFERRKTAIPVDTPVAFTHRFTEDESKKLQWHAFLRKNRLNLDLTLGNVTDAIKEFLLPSIQEQVVDHSESIEQTQTPVD